MLLQGQLYAGNGNAGRAAASPSKPQAHWSADLETFWGIVDVAGEREKGLKCSTNPPELNLRINPVWKITFALISNLLDSDSLCHFLQKDAANHPCNRSKDRLAWG